MIETNLAIPAGARWSTLYLVIWANPLKGGTVCMEYCADPNEKTRIYRRMKKAGMAAVTTRRIALEDTSIPRQQAIERMRAQGDSPAPDQAD
jgi:hypothetical protein